MVLWLLIVASYLLGSISFAKIYSAKHGIDILNVGSKNPGFANTLREVGWPAAWKVLVGDIAKGLIPTVAALYMLGIEAALIVGFAAIFGHVHSIHLKFRGGKGIATSFGVLLVLNPVVILLSSVIYLLVFYFIRISAPSSLAAAWTMPVIGIATGTNLVPYLLVLSIFATWTHRVNIRQFIDNRRVESNAR